MHILAWDLTTCTPFSLVVANFINCWFKFSPCCFLLLFWGFTSQSTLLWSSHAGQLICSHYSTICPTLQIDYVLRIPRACSSSILLCWTYKKKNKACKHSLGFNVIHTNVIKKTDLNKHTWTSYNIWFLLFYLVLILRFYECFPHFQPSQSDRWSGMWWLHL